MKLKNGSILQFMYYTQQAMKFEGSDLDFVWFDEPPPYDIYHANRSRLIDRDGDIWMTMTPLEEPWIFDELWEPGIKGEREDTACFNMFMSDNPHLSAKAVKEYEDTIPEEEREARLYGKWKHLIGRVFNEFDRGIHILPLRDLAHIPGGWKRIEIIDPHPKKPHVYIRCAVDPVNTLYVYEEYEVKGDVEALGNHILSTREVTPNMIIVDTSTLLTGDNITGLDLKKNLAKIIGPFFPAIKKPEVKTDYLRKRLQDTIDLLDVSESKRDYHKRKGIFFRSNCVKSAKQIEHLIWDEGKQKHKRTDHKAIPLKKNDDFADCVMYACAVDPKFANLKQGSFSMCGRR
jgi:phage terminase large subunit-like protein